MNYIKEIDDLIQEKHMLKHPFYVAWTKGLLTRECIQEYAENYYHHVSAFPTYLSALHSHTEDAHTRKEILKNLIEEEAGSPNHPEMWLDFACRLGSKDNEVKSLTPVKEINDLVNTFKTICQSGSVAEGIGALYAYESQIPDICVSKINGLKKFYGMEKPEDWKYFSVHIEADKEHSEVERKLLSHYVNEDNFEDVKVAVSRILDKLWAFLTAMQPATVHC